jgi:hypothetical protein
VDEKQARFYALTRQISSGADTTYLAETGFKVGDAQRCPLCGSFISMLAWLSPYRAELHLSGKEFGDLTDIHAGDVLVSQKFREVYYECGLTGLTGFDPVEVIKVKSRRKLRSRPPMYFRVNAMRGQMALDMDASGFEWVKPPTCSYCRTGIIKRWKRLVLEPGTWTGEDAFVPRGLASQTMVSQRFKDACERHGIKNAIFTPAEEAGHDFYPGESG